MICEITDIGSICSSARCLLVVFCLARTLSTDYDGDYDYSSLDLRRLARVCTCVWVMVRSSCFEGVAGGGRGVSLLSPGVQMIPDHFVCIMFLYVRYNRKIEILYVPLLQYVLLLIDLFLHTSIPAQQHHRTSTLYLCTWCTSTAVFQQTCHNHESSHHPWSCCGTVRDT